MIKGELSVSLYKIWQVHELLSIYKTIMYFYLGKHYLLVPRMHYISGQILNARIHYISGPREYTLLMNNKCFVSFST